MTDSTIAATSVVGTAAALLILAGCAGRLPGPPMPAALRQVPTSAARDWALSTRVATPFAARFDWTFRDEQASSKGVGAIVIVPPDSLRFDFRGPMGSASGAAFVVGNSAVWAVPEDRVRQLVPSYPLLWAMLGQALGPPPGSTVTFHQDPGIKAWRYAFGADTIEYIVAAGPAGRLVAEVRHAGRVVGHVLTTFDSAGRVATSRLDVPDQPARLDLEFYHQGSPDSLPPSLWDYPGE